MSFADRRRLLMALAGKPKFTVTYNGTPYEYEFEKGMTWAQFIASPYNTNNAFYNSGGYVKYNMYRQTLMNGNNAIVATAAIDPNIAYNIYIFDGAIYQNSALSKGWYVTNRCYKGDTNYPNDATFSTYPYLTGKLTVAKRAIETYIIPPAYLSNIAIYTTKASVIGRSYNYNYSSSSDYGWWPGFNVHPGDKSGSFYASLNSQTSSTHSSGKVTYLTYTTNEIYLSMTSTSWTKLGDGWEVSNIQLTLNNNR